MPGQFGVFLALFIFYFFCSNKKTYVDRDFPLSRCSNANRGQGDCPTSAVSGMCWSIRPKYPIQISLFLLISFEEILYINLTMLCNSLVS
uniref:Secreted protein n=1 Tax=Pundamilia nyererei TaxID=303518 RepID=A0A3B4FJV9_9CICH